MKAAVQIFHKKGLHGTRMQMIADEAGVSKSMLHYYFIDKETLYDRVFELTMKNIFPKVNAILVSELPLFQKIAVFMNTYTDVLYENYFSTSFIISEMAVNTERVIEHMVTGAGFDIKVLQKQLDEEYRKKKIRKTDIRVLLINMISLCVFPFIAIEVQLKRYGLNRDQYFELLEKRKAIITEMVISSVHREQLNWN